MTTEERLSSLEQTIDILLDLNRRVVDMIELNQQRIEQNRLSIEQNRLQNERQIQQNERQIQQSERQIQQNERQIQQTQRLWIAFAKHYGLLDDIDFDTDNGDPDPS